jgi:hypothetical protein
MEQRVLMSTTLAFYGHTADESHISMIDFYARVTPPNISSIPR